MDIYRHSLKLLPFKRILVFGGFLAGFAGGVLLCALATYVAVGSTLSSHLSHQTRSLNEMTGKWLGTIARLAELDESDPCSPGFLRGMRRIAFLPDGVHELLYVPDGAVLCSVSNGRLSAPIAIGDPDFTVRGGEMAVWKDRDLRLFDLPDIKGTFIRTGNFAMIVTLPEAYPAAVDWITTRVTFDMDDPGRPGETAAAPATATIARFGCDANRFFCARTQASLAGLIADQKGRIALVVLLAALLGLATARPLRDGLDHAWSFPVRFRKLMNASTLHCVYQPILSLSEARISAVEVLARWRDFDGETVMPSRFLPVAEAHGLTRAMTEILIERVHRDLRTLPHEAGRLRVHFNIYPHDFDAEWLLRVFAPLLTLSDRFTVVVEILECQQIPLETMRETVDALNRNAIQVYVDDFGTGYSNFEYLAHLALSGVKLDRSFGQAPEGSLMAGLLTSAGEMIARVGYPLLVEGVETRERLESLRDCGLVDQAQGYYISRPIPVSQLVAYLRNQRRLPFLADLPAPGGGLPAMAAPPLTTSSEPPVQSDDRPPSAGSDRRAAV